MAIDLKGINPKNKLGIYLQIEWMYWKPLWDFVGFHLLNLGPSTFISLQKNGGTIIKFLADMMRTEITIAFQNLELNTNYYKQQIQEIKTRHGKNYIFDWDVLKNFLNFISNCEGFEIHY